MNKVSLFVASIICVSILGCNLEGNSCVYSKDDSVNQTECKDANTVRVCMPDGLWEEQKCELGCGEDGKCINSLKCSEPGKTRCKFNKLYECVESTQGTEPHYEFLVECSDKCDDEGISCNFDCKNCVYGCNPENNGCAKCDTNKCENGSLRICKGDKSGYEDDQKCALGCDESGTECAKCTGNKCENGRLRVCKNDQSDYEEAEDCALGCDETGTECARCTGNKCENGSLRLCKDDKSGYKEEATVCPLGCNKTGDGCATCESSVCKDGQLKNCKDDKSGYEEPVQCLVRCNAEGTDCDKSCTDDFCKDGFVYRCVNNVLATQGEKCPDLNGVAGSCANATACKQCDESVISLKQRCVSPTEYIICQNGLWTEDKHECPANLLCEPKTDECSEVQSNICYNDSNNIGLLWPSGKQPSPCPEQHSCKADGSACGDCRNGVDTKCDNNIYYICNNGEYEASACSLGWGCHTGANDKGICNECNNNATDCKGNEIKTCVDGVWNSQNCDFGCYNSKQCNVCTPGAKKCQDSELRTCLGNDWKVEPCEYGCSSGGRAECKCKPGTIQCSGDGNKKCTDDGTWGALECAGGCQNGVCYSQCTPGVSNQCSEDIVLSCNADGIWDKHNCADELKVCENGQCVANGTSEPECEPGETSCEAGYGWICQDNGQWYKKECSKSEYCENGECIAYCTPNDSRCHGDDLEVCKKDGTWTIGKCQFGCNAKTGDCYKNCKPKETKCDAKDFSVYLECSDDSWVSYDCPKSKYCKAGVCVEYDTECKPGDKRCKDDFAEVCDEEGNWIRPSKPCEFKCNEKTGECFCKPETHKCNDKGDVVLVCDDEGNWAEELACEFGCNVETGRCKKSPEDCAMGEIICENEDRMAVCYDNYFISISCSKFESSENACKDVACNPKCETDACIDMGKKGYFKFRCDENVYDFVKYEVCKDINCKDCL